MTAGRLVRQALRSMGRYKLRTIFMMLGSFLGVAALTFVVSIGQAGESKLLRTVRQIIGDDAILVVAGGSRMMGSPRGGVSRLTLDDLTAVAKEVPGIADWDPQADMTATVRYNDATATARAIGGSERWDRVWGRGVSRGTSFDAAAVTGSARVALVGETVVRKLFGGADPLGAEVRIGAVPFRVIGVLEAFGNDMHGMDRDNEIVVPISTLMRRLSNVDAVNAAKLLVTNPASQSTVASDIKRVLRERHGLTRDQHSDFTVMTSNAMQDMVSTVRRVVWLYVPLVGGIVLIVGGIVAATLMLSSVSERIAEIGLRRAIGARPEDIRGQFLLETAATVVVGGAAGVLLGYVAMRVVATRMLPEATLSWSAVIVSILASAAVGVLAGVAPARRAARLQPSEALR